MTKYMHACVVLEKDGKNLVIDPGNLSDDFVVPADVVAVVVTHIHADHCDPDKLRAILTDNPDAVVYALGEVLSAVEVPICVVEPGEQIGIAGFELEFTGGQHAIIHPDIPRAGNIGVIVDDLLYYTGDSFAPAGREIPHVLLPVSAPWLKMQESVDFARQAHAQYVYPTHDALLSDKGHAIADRVIGGLLGEGSEYRYVEPSQTITL